MSGHSKCVVIRTFRVLWCTEISAMPLRHDTICRGGYAILDVNFCFYPAYVSLILDHVRCKLEIDARNISLDRRRYD